MAIGVKIDFANIYELEDFSEDFRIGTFFTDLQNGEKVPLKIIISNESHELLPNVFNLAFGPVNNKGQINDKAELSHQNYSRVFSTILLFALRYLSNNSEQYLGIDGSDNLRAYYYWRFLQRNYNYLDQYFDMFGLKYYVRISRFGKTQYDDPFDFEDIQPYPDRIRKTTEWPKLMYNYFIFRLKP